MRMTHGFLSAQAFLYAVHRLAEASQWSDFLIIIAVAFLGSIGVYETITWKKRAS